MKNNVVKRLLAGLGLLILFLVLIVAVHNLYTTKVPGGNDFLPRWQGAQLFFREGLDPYSDEVTAIIQQQIYGRPAQPGEDFSLFVYPFYTIFLLMPLVWLPLSYAWIQAIWLVMLLFALVAGLFLLLSLLQWQPSPLMLGLLLFGMIASYHSTRTLLLGQFAGLIFLWLMAVLWLMQRDRDGWAGFLLALTTIKPQMVLLPLLVLLIWALGQRRWRLIVSFGMSMLSLLGLSFLLLPSWLSGFLAQVAAYPEYTVYASSPLGWVRQLWPAGGAVITPLLLLGLAGSLLWSWRYLPRITAVSTDLFIVLGMTAAISSLMFSSTATTNQLLLYLPLLLLLQTAVSRWGDKWTGLLYVILLGGIWGLFLATLQAGAVEHPVMYWPLPLLILLGLTVQLKQKPNRPFPAGR